MIRIKRADGIHDYHDILRMQMDCLPGDEVLVPHLTREDWFIAWSDGNPAGFAGLTRRGPSVGFLARSGVDERHRGKGLQRKLIKVREAAARVRGYTSVVSNTYDNPQSSNNLIACGYRQFAPAHPWGCEGTQYWIKKL